MAEILKTFILSEDHHSLNAVIEPPVTITTVQSKLDETAMQQDYFQQGFNQGLAQAQQELNEQSNKLTALLHSIPQAVSANRQHLSQDIADIVFAIIQPLFIHQQQNKESIAERISQTIQLLNNKHNLELFLHPDDLALLQRKELSIDVSACKNLRVMADDKLRLGGCVIKSEHGLFDAGIERQIDNLKQILLQIKNGEPRDELV